MTCTWEPDADILTQGFKDLEESASERALMLATTSLQMLTNYRIGTCAETLRPCPVSLPCACGNWQPVMWAGTWFNCSTCFSRCAPLSEIDLPGPIGAVDSIMVNGNPLPLDTGDWRVDDGHLLVWQGVGPSPIPETQNLNLPDTAPGTWSITYSRSYPVNSEARIAVAYLAMEYAKAMGKTPGRCSLPKGVTSVVRNGVSFTVDQGLFQGGLTGIDAVDAFILKWAPAGDPRRTATVFDPRQVRHRTTSLLFTKPAPVLDGGTI